MPHPAFQERGRRRRLANYRHPNTVVPESRLPTTEPRLRAGDERPARNPNDEGHECAAWLARKDRFLNFERPPKAEPSSWADEHYDANFVGIVIERCAQRSAALRDVCEVSTRGRVRACSQHCRCS